MEITGNQENTKGTGGGGGREFGQPHTTSRFDIRLATKWRGDATTRGMDISGNAAETAQRQAEERAQTYAEAPRQHTASRVVHRVRH